VGTVPLFAEPGTDRRQVGDRPLGALQWGRARGRGKKRRVNPRGEYENRIVKERVDLRVWRRGSRIVLCHGQVEASSDRHCCRQVRRLADEDELAAKYGGHPESAERSDMRRIVLQFRKTEKARHTIHR